MNFFDRVKLAAKASNTTIEAVALLAGLSRDSYNSYRKKGNLPRTDEACAMAGALGTTVEYLVDGKAAAGWRPPARLEPIVEDLAVLADDELDLVGRMGSDAVAKCVLLCAAVRYLPL